jgi:O-antigen/teichoic acid export membrane protein
MSAPTRAHVARAVSWMGAGHVVSQGLWLGSLLVLAALLPPKAFGSLASGMVLVNLAGLIVDAGTRGSIVSAPSLTRADLRGALALTTAVGAAATLAIVALAAPMTDAFAEGGDPKVIRVLAIGVLLYAAGIVPLAVLQKRLRFERYAAANIGAATLSSVAAVVAGVAGAGVWALVVRQLTSMGLLSAIAWVGARRLLPARPAGAGEEQRGRRRIRLRQAGWMGFLGLAVTDFVALNADFLVVGNIEAAGGLGLYALAFTLAFAPLTQVSWQVGRVLFPAAAATEEVATVGRRTLVSLRMMGLLLLPFVPPSIVLAPALLPGLLGSEWESMVAPFQILLVVGVGHAMVGMIGESLSGTGNIGLRARINVVWAAAMVALLVPMVSADGIRGAALTHLILFVPFAAAYATIGARRLRVEPARVGAALRPLAGPVGVQAALTAALWFGLIAAGAGETAAGVTAAGAGAVAVAALLWRAPGRPLAEGRAVLGSALRREPA